MTTFLGGILFQEIFTMPKSFAFGQVLFSSACMCLSVCVSVCLCVCSPIISKSYQRILMKFGRMVYNDKISVPFEDEMNRFIRTEVIEKMVFRHHELRPFDNLFSVITSPFLLFKR